MKYARWVIAALVALVGSACAPLTPPQGTQVDAGSGVDGEGQREPSALERYLYRRHQGADTSAVARPYIVLMPFADRSGFQEGVWPIDMEVPRLLSAEMEGRGEWRIVPFAVVAEVVGKRRKLKDERALELGRQVLADIVLLGTIADYDMKRLSVGDPLVGGYKSYTGVAEVQVRALRVEDGSEVATAESRQEQVERDLGLDLLGKPREQDLQFASLKEVEFGSQAFRETVLGKATLASVEELIGQLAQRLQPRELELGGVAAEIISVYGEDVYINLGSESGLRAGYRFAVYPGTRRAQEGGADGELRIGVVEVREVISARLSSVRVLEGEGAIQAGDRLEVVRGENE